MKNIQLWHGGFGLESDYREIRPSAKGRWEYGPGLYLISDVWKAMQYAKGSRGLYLVTISQGMNAKDVKAPVSELKAFTNKHVRVAQRDTINCWLDKACHHMGTDIISVDHLINLCVNGDALASKGTVALTEFLVSKGASFSYHSSYGGGPRQLVVVMDRKKIVRVQKVPSAKLEQSMWDLKFDAKEFFLPT